MCVFYTAGCQLDRVRSAQPVISVRWERVIKDLLQCFPVNNWHWRGKDSAKRNLVLLYTSFTSVLKDTCLSPQQYCTLLWLSCEFAVKLASTLNIWSSHRWTATKGRSCLPSASKKSRVTDWRWVLHIVTNMAAKHNNSIHTVGSVATVEGSLALSAVWVTSCCDKQQQWTALLELKLIYNYRSVRSGLLLKKTLAFLSWKPTRCTISQIYFW